MQKIILAALVVVTLTAAAGSRVELSSSVGLSHDEVISVVTAQGNVERYEEATKAGLVEQWVPASSWQTFYSEPSERSLAEIAEDLAEHDIHPPLYFWTLRPWIAGFGANTARILNIPILLVSAAFLFAFARRYASTAGALLAVAIWLLSPETIRTSATARQYELLGLFAILNAWQAGRLLEGKTDWRNLVGFAAIALGAMLTQYLAAVFILTAVAVVLAQRREIWLRLGVALSGAAFVFVLLHPGFYRHVGRYETVAGFDARLVEAASTLLGFWGWRNTWTTPELAWAVLIVAIAVFAFGSWSLRRPRMRLPLALTVIPASIALLVYLAALTPSHGFAGRHLAFFWPFLALLHTVAVERLIPRAIVPALAASALLIAPAEYWMALQKHSAQPLPRLIASAPQIVTNNSAIGILPRYLREAKADAEVYVSDDLTADTTWLSKLKTGSVVILNPQYLPKGAAEKTEAFLSQNLKRVFSVYTTTVYRRE